MQLLHEAGNPPWNTSCHLVPWIRRSKCSFPYCFWLSMTCLFSLFLTEIESAAACETRFFWINCGVLQKEGISASISCPLEDHSPPQSATENSFLCTGTCHLPSSLPHYTKPYALASAGLCLPAERWCCPAHICYPTLWHAVARVTEYRNRQLLQRQARQKDRNIYFITSQFQQSTLQKFYLKQMPTSLPVL